MPSDLGRHRKNYCQPSENCTMHNLLLNMILTVIEDGPENGLAV
jgi:hypothetical protein